ncbi:unnamed protein product, partial [Iphiclides podalirius]
MRMRTGPEQDVIYMFYAKLRKINNLGGSWQGIWGHKVRTCTPPTRNSSGRATALGNRHQQGGNHPGVGAYPGSCFRQN